ncbi:MAG: nicotinate (nicotinamide) nucleotide adenylyltransferase [Acidobacteria bacterium]|nr:nicotinate (nicotinamide) nucleotide adenylyltransferase [Acidobacteriota bacterium]
MTDERRPLRIAFFGGSFDPPHLGHMAIANALIRQFELDEFVFVPAFHAPHKRSAPTSAFDRYTMLCLATQNESRMTVSRLEIEMPQKPYSVETLGRITQMLPREEIFFVMGADSWRDIRTWREWEKLFEMTDHIVVTRPGYAIETDHVTDDIRERIIDVRGGELPVKTDRAATNIYFTDKVDIDLSATEIRKKIRDEDDSWHDDVPESTAKYIIKYQIYS